MKPRGFTLIEMLVVIAILAVLGAILAPHARQGIEAGRRALCSGNLREMQIAFDSYLTDHDGAFFPFRENLPDGVLWYWGFESAGGGAEGSRPVDMSRARLAPYLGGGGGVEICPSLPYRADYFKRKFQIASYGYGLNAYMLAGLPGMAKTGVRTMRNVECPSDTITWGDGIQINTWQAPASASRPMLEEWYVLDNMPPPHFHFRHNGWANVVMADGSVRAFEPHSVDLRCDGRVGYIEPPRQETWLLTKK